ARYLVATGGDDPSAHQARNLAQQAATLEPTVPRLLLAAELAEDRNQRAVWVGRAEALAAKGRVRPGAVDPKILLAKAAVPRLSLSPRDALPLYRDVLRQDPDDVAAIRGEVELLDDVGLKRTALARLDAAVARNPRSVLLLNMYASELRSLGRTTE